MCWLFKRKDKQIAHLKEYIEQLEKRYGYLRENFELEVEKRITAYQKVTHSEMVKEISFWMETAERLQKYINHIQDDKA